MYSTVSLPHSCIDNGNNKIESMGERYNAFLKNFLSEKSFCGPASQLSHAESGS